MDTITNTWSDYGTNNPNTVTDNGITVTLSSGTTTFVVFNKPTIVYTIKLKNTRNKIKKYTVVKSVFSLTPFKYLFYIPTRPLVIFNYEICEVVFYDFIAEMFAIALILIGVVRVLKTKRKN